MKTRTIIKESLFARWIWIPILIFLGLLQTLPWIVKYGYIGAAIGLWWFYPWPIREALRLKRKLPRYDIYEGTTQGSKDALECYLNILKVDKEKPHSPSPIQH